MSDERLNPAVPDPVPGPEAARPEPESPGGGAGGAEGRRRRPGAEPVPPPPARPPLAGRGPKPGPALARVPSTETQFTPEQRLLILDAWRRSGLPAGDFAPLVGVSKHTLYAWKKKFDTEGPAGLMDRPRGAPAGSRLPEVTKRTILMLKEAHPDWGCQRISDLLLRGPALPASPAAGARVLHEEGYESTAQPTR